MKLSKKSNNSEELFEQIDRLKTFCGLGIQNSEGDNSNVDVKRAHKVKEVIFFMNLLSFCNYLLARRCSVVEKGRRGPTRIKLIIAINNP